jgi:NTP pyrophosphatase (non-canonical NTP hydrolase)
MTIEELSQRAAEIREKFAELEKANWGKEWDVSDIVVGLMGDVGDLAKLIQAKEGMRSKQDDITKKLEHELSDCLFCLFVLANRYNIDIARAFMSTMDDIEHWIQNKGKKLNEAR